MPRLHVLADSRRRRWRAPSGPEAYGEYFWRRFLEVVVVLKIEPRNLFHIATRVSKFDLIHASAGLIAHGHRRSCLRRPSAPPEVDARIADAHTEQTHVKSSQVKLSQAQHSTVSQSVSPVQQLQHDQACVHRRQSRGPFGPQSHIEHTHPIVPGGINPGRARDSRINHARILVLAGQVAQILKRQKREPNTPIHRVPCRVPFVFESFRLAVSICLKSIWTRTHTLLHI